MSVLSELEIGWGERFREELANKGLRVNLHIFCWALLMSFLQFFLHFSRYFSFLSLNFFYKNVHLCVAARRLDGVNNLHCVQLT
jgi:hypothetical protein